MEKDTGGTILSGIAGEYFVAGELSRRGYIASLTLRNTKGIDIFVSNKGKMIGIQVKTRRMDKTERWDLGSKPLECRKEWKNIFYVLVEISSDSMKGIVNYYVVPKNTLNKLVEKNHLRWLKGKNKRTGKERTSQRRMLLPLEHSWFQESKDKWGQIFD